MTEEDRISIPEFFKGKKIFVTGGSGFMGKVLIEKILRSCPDVSTIYVIIRPKRGKTAEERIKQMTDAPLFDVLKKEYPENLKKIVPVFGDMAELNLGLSPEARQELIDQVNIIYHGAASVRFDDPLKSAILLNTRGTREVALLAREMKRLEVLMHLSTAYCQSDKQVIEERMYPPHADWREAIAIAETGNDHILNVLTQHYMSPLPNTYTFTKSMAEHVINDICVGHIPTIIFRPSIVISTVKEPMPGWNDNFNGPVGILVAVGKGILRSVYTQPDLTADYIPVDLVIKALLVATWKKAMEKKNEEKCQVTVYNASNNDINNITFNGMVDIGLKMCWDYPLNNILWYPVGCVTSCYPNHFLRVIFFHILPALFIDGLLKVTGHKPLLFRIQRKIYIANMALQYFITQEWAIRNDRSSNLESHLVPGDQSAFAFERDDVTPFEYFRRAVLGARQYLLKEDISTFENAKKHSRRMYAVYIFFNILWYLATIYILFFKLDLMWYAIKIVDKVYLYFMLL